MNSPFIGGFGGLGGATTPYGGTVTPQGEMDMNAYLPQNGGGDGAYNQQAGLLANGGASYSGGPSQPTQGLLGAGAQPSPQSLAQIGQLGQQSIAGGVPGYQGFPSMGGFGYGGSPWLGGHSIGSIGAF